MIRYIALIVAVVTAGLSGTPVAGQDGVSETPAEKRARMRASELPDNVLTSFHRRAVDSKEEPWRAIGRVNVGGFSHCTGSLIAENLVLTAAHCLYAKHMGKMAPTAIVHFVTGYAKGEYLAHSKVARYTVGRGFDGKDGTNPANLRHDWALLLLEKPLGAEFGYLELHENLKRRPMENGKRPRVALPSADIITAGYPGDRSHVLSLEEGCSVQSVQDRGRVLITDCTAIEGDSGGPILQNPDGKWVLIGLNVARVQNETVRGSVILSALAFRDTLAVVQRQLEESAPPAPPSGK